jgi:hypothetical protein
MTTIQTNVNTGIVGPSIPFDPANPTNASTTMQGGRAVFENDNYRITAGDNNEVNITNKHTGENYQIWGDPHVNVDGQHAFDFWGTTTFKLEDGTNVTIQTTPWANNPNATLASKVTITNGDYGVQISGVDTNKTGDLKIDEAKGWGQMLDWAVDDGNVLQENPAGKGFVAVDDNGIVRKVDQQYINQTDLTKGGADKLQNQFKDAFRLLGGLISISFAGMFLGALAKAIHHAGSGHGPILPQATSRPGVAAAPRVSALLAGPTLSAGVQGGPSTNPKTPFEGFFDKVGLQLTLARAQA